MRMFLRNAADKAFTVITSASVVVLCAVLVLILGPMLIRGSSAVLFSGTVEFRKMQMSLFGRGNADVLQAEIEHTAQARRPVYETISTFKGAVDAGILTARLREIHRRFNDTVDSDIVGSARFIETRSLARELRSRLEDAFRASDRETIDENINAVMAHKADLRFASEYGQAFFQLAEEYVTGIKGINLEKRAEYAAGIAQVEAILRNLFGPAPDQPLPSLAMEQFGATRSDQVARFLDELLWETVWQQIEPGQPRVPIRTLRAETFAGTPMEPVFAYISDNISDMMHPRPTLYWQFFIDDSIPGRFFGGVGPEILGTLFLTIIGMVFAFPLGVISAAYLVEVGGNGPLVRIIRLCVNTLAGVPSIVFGLFGLAFFVLFLFPRLGLEPKANMLAAGMTLAVLTLPVMIRASEEAIRAVPPTYKEASLALGAGKFRTFVAVIFPAALPGILTGAILSISRIAGETAAVLFTGAVALGPVPRSIFEPTRTLPYGSFDMAVGDRIAMRVPHQQFGMVMTLIALVLILNGAAIVLRGRIFRKLRGH
ncbi:MAG TPA: phosphate ABC transporter permease PstA [Sedimentisphaerales bacterium]|nr:phosphate ABC transporter permease PstA [Sedimentisphaerales bacterium]